MKTAAVTDKGLVRANNEDRFLVLDVPPLLAVADGMGGHQAGEIASGIVVDSIRKSFENISQQPADELLSEAVLLAGSHVAEYARKNPRCADMGTTLVLALLLQGKCVIANIGDSRAYLFHHSVLRQITKDHSMIAELIEAGIITPKQAETHPMRHMITRALGAEKEETPELFHLDAVSDDILLLCSDGLTDMLSDAEIQGILADSTSLKMKAQKLLACALEKGGRDNCTILLGQFEEGDVQCSQGAC